MHLNACLVGPDLFNQQVYTGRATMSAGGRNCEIVDQVTLTYSCNEDNKASYREAATYMWPANDLRGEMPRRRGMHSVHV